MKHLNFVVCVLFLGSVTVAQAAPSRDKVWVIVRPIQCLGNPWEKEWLKHHPHQDAKYPIRKEVELIKKFFAKKHVPILDVRRKPYEGLGVCQACDCSRGDVLYVLIYADNASQMIKMGYTERIPAADVPLKK